MILKHVKRAVSAFVAAILLFSLRAYGVGNDPAVSAEAAVLIDASSGKVLFEKNPRKKLPMASTTKIMTALIALETCEGDAEIRVPREAVGTEGSSVYLTEGEKFSITDLLHALMLESANDAAAALAVHCAGSLDAFAKLMNDKAKALGLSDTHFVNPHGLPDGEHYTTAYDLAMLTSFAYEVDGFNEIVSTYRYECGGRLFINHNRLLKSYEGCIGVKTGYTKASGRCLVSAAERDGLRLIAVTLNAPSDWKDHKMMLDYGFERYESLNIAEAGGIAYRIPVVGSDVKDIYVTNREAIRLTVKKGNHSINERIMLKRFYYADVEKDSVVGQVIYYCDGVKIASVSLYAEESAYAIRYKSIFEKLFEFFLK
ncbi:MAG: D-alanyl-D-alanine carboxypeptidase [Ruminococcaceae bacterium]|nr:D-alanyl-D-alanine carboxypeptidase [Oscillospiraceae bacterium]